MERRSFSSCHFPNSAIVTENKLFPAAVLSLWSLKEERGRGVHWKGEGKQKCPQAGRGKDTGTRSHDLLKTSCRTNDNGYI